jgi:hypothetical protein
MLAYITGTADQEVLSSIKSGGSHGQELRMWLARCHNKICLNDGVHPTDSTATSPVRELRKQVRDLKRLLAEKTLEVDFFKGCAPQKPRWARHVEVNQWFTCSCGLSTEKQIIRLAFPSLACDSPEACLRSRQCSGSFIYARICSAKC